MRSLRFSLLLAPLCLIDAFSALSAELPKDRKPIPEILALKDGEEIPREIFDKYDSRTIGESIVARIRIKREIPREKQLSGPINYDYFADTELQLHLPSRKIPRVLEMGIINMHQGGVGVIPSFDKLTTEDSIMGLRVPHPDFGLDVYATPQMHHPIYSVRPKYLEVALTAPRDIGIDVGTPVTSRKYGEVIAILEDHVKPRVLFTDDDTGITQKETHANTLFAKKPVLQNLRLQKQDLGAQERPQTGYFEGQVLGETDVRDIREWRIPANLDDDRLRMLKLTGLPIYESKEITKHGRYQYVRGRKLYSGNPKRLQYVRTIGLGKVAKEEVRKIEFKNPLELSSRATLEPKLAPLTPRGADLVKGENPRFHTPGGRFYEVVEKLESGIYEDRYVIATPERQKAILRVGKNVALQAKANDFQHMPGTIESVGKYQILTDESLNPATRIVTDISKHPDWEGTIKLAELVSSWIDEGVFVPDFKPELWGWSEKSKRWLIMPALDSPPIRIISGLTPQQAYQRFREHLDTTWKPIFGKASTLPNHWNGPAEYEKMLPLILHQPTMASCVRRGVRKSLAKRAKPPTSDSAVIE
jgi:hypothetical protein